MEPNVPLHIRRRSTPIYSIRPQSISLSQLSSNISSISETPSIATAAATATSILPGSRSASSAASTAPGDVPSQHRQQRPPLRPVSGSSDNFRMRSDSGLSFHMNEDAVRQYIDYAPDGSPTYPADAAVPRSRNGTLSGSRASSYTLPPAPTSTAAAFAGPDSIIDFMSANLVKVAFDDQTIADRWLDFARSRDCAQNIEYILKIHEYIRNIQRIQDSISSITTQFTSFNSRSPVTLPPSILRGVSSDARQVSNAYLPRLESLFLESQYYLEQHVIPDIYYAFLRNQFAMCICAHMSLSVPSEASPFSSLGESFCLSDARVPGYPITHASDGYARLSGYKLDDIIHNNVRRLDGPATNAETLQRIKTALKKGEESVELLLNYRRDGTPFWNLLYLCPLTDTLTHDVRFYLAAQVDISEGIRSTSDVTRALKYGSECELAHTQCATPDISSTEKRRSALSPIDKLERNSSNRRRMFSFRKAAQHQHVVPPSPTQDLPLGLPPNPALLAVDALLHTPKDVGVLCPTGDINAFYTPYTRFLMLSVVNSPMRHGADATAHKKKAGESSLSVSFCSKPTLEALGLAHPKEAVGVDVFDLFSSANCTSLSKGVKSAVYERVVRDGRSLIVDVVLKGDVKSKFLGHWTPLKSAENTVSWVMFCLTPAIAYAQNG